MNNVEFVKSLYDAFKRGDLETIFAASDSNIDWFSNADPALLPWGGEGKGVAAAKEYFKELVAHVKFEFVHAARNYRRPEFRDCAGPFDRQLDSIRRSIRRRMGAYVQDSRRESDRVSGISVTLTPWFRPTSAATFILSP